MGKCKSTEHLTNQTHGNLAYICLPRLSVGLDKLIYFDVLIGTVCMASSIIHILLLELILHKSPTSGWAWVAVGRYSVFPARPAASHSGPLSTPYIIPIKIRNGLDQEACHPVRCHTKRARISPSNWKGLPWVQLNGWNRYFSSLFW